MAFKTVDNVPSLTRGRKSDIDMEEVAEAFKASLQGWITFDDEPQEKKGQAAYRAAKYKSAMSKLEAAKGVSIQTRVFQNNGEEGFYWVIRSVKK